VSGCIGCMPAWTKNDITRWRQSPMNNMFDSLLHQSSWHHWAPLNGLFIFVPLCRYNNIPATLNQATVQAAWDSGSDQTLSKCINCPGYGVLMLVFSYVGKKDDPQGADAFPPGQSKFTWWLCLVMYCFFKSWLDLQILPQMMWLNDVTQWWSSN